MWSPTKLSFVLRKERLTGSKQCPQRRLGATCQKFPHKFGNLGALSDLKAGDMGLQLVAAMDVSDVLEKSIRGVRLGKK